MPSGRLNPDFYFIPFFFLYIYFKPLIVPSQWRFTMAAPFHRPGRHCDPPACTPGHLLKRSIHRWIRRLCAGLSMLICFCAAFFFETISFRSVWMSSLSRRFDEFDKKKTILIGVFFYMIML